MQPKKKKTGMAWYRRQHYDKIRRTFIDGQNLPAQYDEWLSSAQANCEQIAVEGREVVRVEIEPEEFTRWCSANHFRTDGRGRDCYVKLMTYRIAIGQHAEYSEAA